MTTQDNGRIELSDSKNLWGGRFTGEADRGFVDFNRSFGFDRRLFAADVRASVAHCNSLARAGVLTSEEAKKINDGLQTILDRGIADAGYFDKLESEDVHSFVESRLVELIGDTGRKLHTGRSRNDQVATDLRLWLREAVDDLAPASWLQLRRHCWIWLSRISAPCSRVTHICSEHSPYSSRIGVWLTLKCCRVIASVWRIAANG